MAASHSGFGHAIPRKIFSRVSRNSQAATSSQARFLQVCNYPLQSYFIYLLDLPSLRVSRTVLSLVELVTSRIPVSSKGEEGEGGAESFQTYPSRQLYHLGSSRRRSNFIAEKHKWLISYTQERYKCLGYNCLPFILLAHRKLRNSFVVFSESLSHRMLCRTAGLREVFLDFYSLLLHRILIGYRHATSRG